MEAGVCSVYGPMMLLPVFCPARTSVPLVPELLTLKPPGMLNVAVGVVESLVMVSIPLLAMRNADVAVVVTNPEVSSVRDSDRIIGMLDSKTLRAERGERVDKHLLVTRYDAARAARNEMLKVEDVLEILSIPLLGIIPESEEVLKASNVGSPVTLNNPNSAPSRAYFDAAKRLKGEQVDVVIPLERTGFIGRLFGRRVA